MADVKEQELDEQEQLDPALKTPSSCKEPDARFEKADVVEQLADIQVTELNDEDGVRPHCLCDILSQTEFEELPVESLKVLRSAVYMPTSELVAMLQNYGVKLVPSDEDCKRLLLRKLRTILKEEARAAAGIEVFRQEKEQAKLKSTRAERAAIECCVCFINCVNVAYVPCGHAISCDECAAKIEVCPLCQVKYKQTLKLYFA